MVPSSAAKLSTVRQEVVPTQMIRPPFFFVSLMTPAVSREDADVLREPLSARSISIEEMVNSTVEAVMEEQAEEPILSPRRGLFSRRRVEDTEELPGPPEPEPEYVPEPIGPEPDLRDVAQDCRERYLSRKRSPLPPLLAALPPTAALLALLTVWILISRHDMYNGFLLCLSVLLMYLTDFTEQECGRMLTALGGAVLAAFFVFQGLAFVFRPYDSLRYLGLYANTNINALFYQMVYCVFFGYFCILELKRTHPFLKWGSFCFACAMWPFVLLTMCRSAVLGMAAATAAGVGILLWKRRGARVSRCLLYLCGLFLGSALSFPIVYGAVRYLPAVFHHPIWFADEYSEEKVHSWDPYDSGKYTDWRDVLRENFGRFFPSVAGSGSRQTSAPDASGWENSSALNAPKWEDTSEPDAPEWEDTSEPDASEWEDTSEPDAPEWEDSSASDASGWEDSSASDAPGEGNPPVSPDPEAVQAGNVSGEASANGPLAGGASVKGNSVAGRMVIYRHYLSMLNLRGHAESENGIQLTEHFYAPHAHNIVLQYAFNYGLPAGILLLAYMAASGIRFLLLCIRNENGTPVLLGLLLFASIAVFGMLEVVWRYGQLSHALLLLLPRFAWQGRTGGTDSPEIHAGGAR